MKSIYAFGIFLFLIVFSLNSCSTATNSAANANNLDKIILEKVAMNGRTNLEINAKDVLTSSTGISGASDAGVGNTTEEVWNKIHDLVGKLDLAKMETWESPSQKRFYDGARACVLQIHSNGKIYQSQSFDEGEPPAQLKEIYDYLESLVVQ